MGSGWIRDPVVASAGWWLVVVALGWAGLAAFVMQDVGSVVAWTNAAALAGCAIGVLRGERWCIVVAAGVLVAELIFTVLLGLLNLPIMIMLAGAFVRARAGEGAGHVRDPAATSAGTACLVAAVAGVLWIAGWSEFSSGWEEFLVKTALIGMPALVLGVAAIGMVLGTPGWAVVATGGLVVSGLVVLVAGISDGLVPGRVPMDLALLASAAFAYVRLLRLARGAGVR